MKDTLSKQDIRDIAKALYELYSTVEIDFWVNKKNLFTAEQYEEILFEDNTNFQIANLIHFGLIDQDSLTSEALTNLINLYDDMVSYEYMADELGLLE